MQQEHVHRTVIVTDLEVAVHDYAFFATHAIVGSYFTLAGLWCTWNILVNYNIWRMSDGCYPFRSHLCYRGPFKFRFPLESLYKVFVFTVLVVTSTVSCTLPSLHCNSIIQFQHILSSGVYLLSGVLELAIRNDWVTVPGDTDRACNILGFTISAVIFYSHNGHASELNKTLHSYFFPLTCAACVSMILEGFNRTNVMAALARAFVGTLIGIWFIQVALILYPVFPQNFHIMDDDELYNVMSVPTLFCFHLTFVFVVFILMAISVSRRLQKKPMCPHVALNGHCSQIISEEWHKNAQT